MARQSIITRPKVAARLEGSTLVKAQGAGNSNEDAYAAELVHPYHFYQQATKIAGVKIAPGEMTLRPRQREKLEAELLRYEEVYAFIDPQGEEEAFLTPGPPLFGWSYVGKALVVALLAAGLCLRVDVGVMTLVIMYTALGILYAQLGGRYADGLHDWIEPVNKIIDSGQGAGPQVQGEVTETLELHELADERLKVGGWSASHERKH